MTPIAKIAIGALVTTALAGVLHGPMGLGARCAAVSAIPSTTAQPSGAAMADAKAVLACQKNIDQVVLAKTMWFGEGKAQIAPVSKGLLDAIGKVLVDCIGTTVEVAGHTDRVGDAERNKSLSQERAEAVKAALVERGVPAERLVAIGYGGSAPTDPAAARSNPDDRRIVFTATAPAAPATN